MVEPNQGIIEGTIVAIVAAVFAGASAVAAYLAYRHNKKSEQIKIAREEYDRILTKDQKLIELNINSLVSDSPTSQLVFLFHVEEVMKECEYFGYLIHKKVIQDEDITGYYKPEITKIFVEVMSPGRRAFKKMNEKSHQYPDLLGNIEEHIKLVDKIVSYWDHARPLHT